MVLLCQFCDLMKHSSLLPDPQRHRQDLSSPFCLTTKIALCLQVQIWFTTEVRRSTNTIRFKAQTSRSSLQATSPKISQLAEGSSAGQPCPLCPLARTNGAISVCRGCRQTINSQADELRAGLNGVTQFFHGVL